MLPRPLVPVTVTSGVTPHQSFEGRRPHSGARHTLKPPRAELRHVTAHAASYVAPQTPARPPHAPDPEGSVLTWHDYLREPRFPGHRRGPVHQVRELFPDLMDVAREQLERYPQTWKDRAGVSPLPSCALSKGDSPPGASERLLVRHATAGQRKRLSEQGKREGPGKGAQAGVAGIGPAGHDAGAA